MHGGGMRRARTRGAIVLGTAVFAIGAAGADARQPRIDVKPTGLNGTRFSLGQHDYVSRCVPGRTRLRVIAPHGWRAAIGRGHLESGGQARGIAAKPGRRVRVRLAKRGADRVRTYGVRCLPRHFPEYRYHRRAPGGPDLFAMQLGDDYAAIFDDAGVPIWWLKADGEPDNVQVLRDGTLAYDPVDELSFQEGDYEIRTLDGRLLRKVRGAAGTSADIHEIQLLKNGNYLIGAQEEYTADATAFGGSADSRVTGISIQEVTPKGKLRWRWDSRGHIGLEETGRWWGTDPLQFEPYDVVHWNSAEVGGNFVYLSFRHLDAVYKVDRRDGHIVWKIGGTPTPQSLQILGDPHADYPLGGQHDARVLGDGTVTIHDNRTNLGDPPRVVRYRIDQHARTAKLVQAFEDPSVPESFCCGSSRRLESKDWLVDWGGDGLVGAYDNGGKRLFGLRLADPDAFSYRANPVPEGAVRDAELRHAMDRIAKRGHAG